MIRFKSHIGATQLRTLAVVPMIAATFACTGTVSTPDGEPMSPMTPTGSPTSPSGTPTTPGTGSPSPTGTGTTPAPTGTMAPPVQPVAGQPLPVDMRGMPVYTRFNRITNEQYENSARALLKLNAPTGLTDGFLHAVTGVTDFANNERVVIVNDTVWRDFQSAAEALAAKVTATDQALQAVVATTDVATFIKTFG